MDRQNFLGYLLRQRERLRVSKEKLLDNKLYGHGDFNSSSDALGYRPWQRVHHVLCCHLLGGNDVG